MPKGSKARTATQKRAQRRKARAEYISLPGGETAPQMPAGRDRRHTNQGENPMQTAINARIRQTGLSQDDAKTPMAGCAVGRRLMIDHTPDRAELWQAVQHMRMTWLAYDRANGSPNRHAQCLRIMAPTPALHADASSPAPDLRTQDERDRAAVTAWMRLQGWLSYTDAAAYGAAVRHVVDEPDQPVSDWCGIVLALQCVSDGIKGRPIRRNGRDRA